MKRLARIAQLSAWLVLALIAPASFAQSTSYDPLATKSDATRSELKTLDLSFTDSQRQREIPLRIYLPASLEPAPVVLFSHGLGGSREGNPYLGEHWSARGYVVVVIQHHGSDDTIWRGIRPDKVLARLKQAANLENALLRFKDVSVVIDQLEKWNHAAESPTYSALVGRMDFSKIGMSGHSFGAVTTQAVSGQRTPLGEASFTDARIKAAVVMSPSTPKIGDPKVIFGDVKIPWLLMTGTHDVAFVGDADMASRLGVFPALPAGAKYEIVLDGAEHNAFGDRALAGENRPRNANHHRVILALSTAFWDAYLRQDAAAKAWLDGAGAMSVLEPKDHWQRK